MKNEEDWHKLIMAGGELVLEIVLAGYCTENDATGDSPWETIIGPSISSLSIRVLRRISSIEFDGGVEWQASLRSIHSRK
jgi:hypothetical protein